MTESVYPYTINTYSYMMREPAADCLARLGDLGHATFELMMYPGHAWPADMDTSLRRRFANQLEANGLRILTLNQPNIDINIGAATEEMRTYSLAILRQVIELAGDLEIPGVIIGPGKANPLLPAPTAQLTGQFFKALDQLLPLARKAGTALLAENMPFAFLPDANGLMAALDDYGADEIGVVYDVANGAFIAEDLGTGLTRVRARLKMVHLSDTTTEVYRHDPIGFGCIRFADVARDLNRLDYGGPVALEIISTDPDREIPASIAKLSAMGWDETLPPLPTNAP